MSNLPAQFILVQLVPLPNGKTDKIPLGRDGRTCNAHDPANWLTYDEARAAQGSRTDLTTGFVLTAEDPYVFLDWDDCRGPDGQWIPQVVERFTPFMQRGAAGEVSQSGRGLHVLARADQARVADRRNKYGTADRPDAGNWCEFYSQGRFVAFSRRGLDGWQGSFDVDITDLVLAQVPQREAEAVAIPTGRDPEWVGPEDDDELIRRMLRSSPGIGAAFGNGATVQDLWNANAAVLGRIWPSPSGAAYDASSADMALMIHLAFWTGRDGPRMDRLFRRSGLMREKWEKRADYRAETIGKGRMRAAGVYKDPRGPQPSAASLPGAQPSAYTLSARPDSTFLTIAEMQEYFKGCVYVMSVDRVMLPGGMLVKPSQFKSYFGGYEFTMSHAGGPKASTTNAFEAFTECKLYDFPKATGLCFRPLEEPGAIMSDGKVNTYFPAKVETAPGDISRWEEQLQKLLPVQSDREIIHNYLTILARHRGVKIRWAPVIQGVEGNGKGLLVEVARYIVGKEYTYTPRSSDIPKQFNAWIRNRLLVGVNEVHMEGRRDFLDAIKPLITDEEMPTEPKGADQFLIENYCNWIMTTNYRDAIIKSRNDRRFAMFFTGQQSIDDIERCGMGGDYFPSLWKWLREGGFAAIADHYQRRALTVDLDTFVQRAPATSSAEAAVMASMGRIEQEIYEAVEAEEAGFRKGWISTWAVTRVLERIRVSVSPLRMRTILEDMGYRQVVRSSRVLMNEDGRRPVVYVRAEQWREGLTIDDYCRDQGYGSDIPVSTGSVVPFRLPGG